jgi:hypothetical protein
MDNEFDYVLPRLDAGDEDDKYIAKYIRQLKAEVEQIEANASHDIGRLNGKLTLLTVEKKKLEAEIDRLQKYEETHKYLRLYLQERGVNDEAMAEYSYAALEAFQIAEEGNDDTL